MLLEKLDEKRMEAILFLELYRGRLPRAYDKRVWPRSFAEGSCLLRATQSVRGDSKDTKFSPNYEGSYLDRKAYDSGYDRLSTIEGEDQNP